MMNKRDDSKDYEKGGGRLWAAYSEEVKVKMFL